MMNLHYTTGTAHKGIKECHLFAPSVRQIVFVLFQDLQLQVWYQGKVEGVQSYLHVESKIVTGYCHSAVKTVLVSANVVHQ